MLLRTSKRYSLFSAILFEKQKSNLIIEVRLRVTYIFVVVNASLCDIISLVIDCGNKAGLEIGNPRLNKNEEIFKILKCIRRVNDMTHI